MKKPRIQQPLPSMMLFYSIDFDPSKAIFAFAMFSKAIFALDKGNIVFILINKFLWQLDLVHGIGMNDCYLFYLIQLWQVTC
jgi:hypothetical protein